MPERLILKGEYSFFREAFLNSLSIAVWDKVSQKRGAERCEFNTNLCCPCRSVISHITVLSISGMIHFRVSMLYGKDTFLCCFKLNFFKKTKTCLKDSSEVKIGIVF